MWGFSLFLTPDVLLQHDAGVEGDRPNAVPLRRRIGPGREERDTGAEYDRIALEHEAIDFPVELGREVPAAGLPGDRRDIALFHYAIEGLLFDRITGPLMPEESVDDIVSDFAARLLPPESP